MDNSLVNRSYVLRRLWLWPLVLWMRPLEVLDRSRTALGLELTTAILGAGVWGALAGVALWLRTGDPQAIWVLSLAVAGAVTGVVATVSALGIALGVWLSASVLIYLFVPIALVFVAFSLKLAWDEHTGHETADWIGYTWITVFLVFLPIIAFALFPHSELNQIPQWGVALGIALSSGVIVGFFFDDDDGIAARGSTGDLRIGAEVQAAWLIVSWGLFLALAAVAYVLGPQVAELHAKLDRLALFLVLAPLVLTGLPAWPLTAVMALRQYGSRAGQASAPERLARTIAFRWQSFAYPLPGLESYLIRLGQDTGPAAALGAIQAVQFGTLQQAAARRAARKLASDPATALPFCGTVAVETNSATLATLVRVGTAGLAVAVLAAKQDQEDQDPLLLDPGRIRRRRFWPPLFWGTRNQGRVEDSEPDPARIRERPLSERIVYAERRLEGLGAAALVPEYRGLLDALGELADLSDLRQLGRLSPRLGPAPGKDIWLAGGWAVIRAVRGVLRDLDHYGDLTTTTKTARRRLLETSIGRLQMVSWEDTPDYWRGIAEELVTHWVEVLKAEARQVRELLRLEVVSPVGQFVPGNQTLGLLVRNSTGELARKCELRMAPTADLTWVHPQARFGLLEGGKETQVRLDFRAEAEGALRVQGRLEARDLADNPFSLDFAFQIQVAKAGRPYGVPDYQPYVVGEGLPNDRTFVGREDLLGWLRGLWLQPEGKPAVVLVGQRRIGKTSLLHKIERAGLPGTNLLGLTINIQGLGSEYDFLNETATRMAERLELPPDPLDRSEPYAAFKTFLRGVRERLGAGRGTGCFLLMLDEADLIPERRLGERLPGFLRALMQEPQYPTLLLFCGTTRLRAMARDYFSILFNTARFRTLSYLTREESSQVLQKPARGILDYDPAVLADAYRLTRGQPLLLQMLGAELVNRFNEQTRRGEARSDYVDTNDFAAALEGVVRAGTNAAFENHWEDSDAATHRVLAALAWATDEAARNQLDVGGLEAAMDETRLTLPRERTFPILERLADDEILERDGPTYRFWVPLFYRRWVA